MKTIASCILAVCSSTALNLDAAIIIDYNACQAVSSYSQARMDAVAQLRFYFEHASVGGNMISGLNSLHTANSLFYQLTSQGSSATPPATTSGGVIYDFSRGNPGWQAKVDDFATDMASWATHTDLALNKFCYIDPDTDFTYYRDSMTTLEATYPGVDFVYMTIPLTTGSDEDNADRNEFNNVLREWVNNNNKILFDVADIEAHDLSGVEQTFIWGSDTFQRLYSGYTSDGGHLNATGAELVARGFYALGDAVSSVPEPSAGWICLGLASGIFAAYRRLRSA